LPRLPERDAPAPRSSGSWSTSASPRAPRRCRPRAARRGGRKCSTRHRSTTLLPRRPSPTMSSASG
jgi:hypothetical protein